MSIYFFLKLRLKFGKIQKIAKIEVRINCVYCTIKADPFTILAICATEIDPYTCSAFFPFSFIFTNTQISLGQHFPRCQVHKFWPDPAQAFYWQGRKFCALFHRHLIAGQEATLACWWNAGSIVDWFVRCPESILVRRLSSVFFSLL